MAHPCIECGSECHCNGDIDDAVVSKTPANCIDCGCGGDGLEEYDDDEDDEPFGWECLGCGSGFAYKPMGGECPNCGAYAIEPMY